MVASDYSGAAFCYILSVLTDYLSVFSTWNTI
jgi:hypothetical protein